MYKKEINQENIKDFSARKRTALLALQALRDAKCPDDRAFNEKGREEWELHNRACIAKLAQLVYGVEFG